MSTSISKVFFASARVPRFREWWVPEQSLLYRMEKIFFKAGFDKIVKGKKVGIKPHMGEPGDVHYMRPVFLSKLVEIVKESGGDPMILETSGLGWLPGRTSAEKYLEAARKNGFSEETMGAPIVLADGDYGLDAIEIDGIPIAKGFSEMDALIVLSHFTCHIQAGVGGAIKNLGVGCVSKAGKFMVHYHGYPEIVKTRCNQCGECVKYCPINAITDFKIDRVKCTRCNVCLDVCKRGAVKAEGKTPEELNKQIALNASAVAKIFKDRLGSINLLTDIIPHCDCHPHSDIPFVPDIGILASKDPVSIDNCSIDLVNESPGIPLSAADDADALKPGLDKFSLINPQTNWRMQIETSERLGLGNQEYSLKEIKT